VRRGQAVKNPGRSRRHGRKAVAPAIICCIGLAATLSSQARSQERGVASVYGDPGEVTATGERVSTGGLTAAHRSLPLGSSAWVINEHNGRSVTVRINDRGPFVRGRIIDLTSAVARMLGIDGLGQVQVIPMGTAATSRSTPDDHEISVRQPAMRVAARDIGTHGIGANRPMHPRHTQMAALHASPVRKPPAQKPIAVADRSEAPQPEVAEDPCLGSTLPPSVAGVYCARIVKVADAQLSPVAPGEQLYSIGSPSQAPSSPTPAAPPEQPRTQ